MSIYYVKSTDYGAFWAGLHSVANRYGYIDLFLYEVVYKYYLVNNLINNTYVGILHGDIYNKHFYDIFIEKIKNNNTLLDTNANLIIGTLCYRADFYHNYIITTPLDDNIFSKGLENVLGNDALKKWEERLPIAFWRGGDSHQFRVETCKKLKNNINANVKIVIHPLFNKDDEITNALSIRYTDILDDCFCSERVSIKEHYNYKYILIIDGACIASSHQWVFGSGSVPIMISNPENVYWFKHLLEPMVHYVPVKIDLSDIEEKIEWLINNDELAKKIMLNALEFSKKYFSSEYQKKYIINEVSRIIKLSNPEKDIIDIQLSDLLEDNDNNWITCGMEEDVISLPLGTIIRYGTYEKGWVTSVVNKPQIKCENNYFQNDPAPFFKKIVQKKIFSINIIP
jgi:hypothetical protein